MSDGRKVRVFKYEKVPGKAYSDKVEQGRGIFRQFGLDYEEFEDGPATFSTAIVEMPDGTVQNVPVDLIVFEDKMEIK